ncbi:MAG: MarR family transcriptional regulator [Mogibacterium sp.]|nr:MarR family transcriptional regulator [Mogibacterium sp.]
MSSMERAVAITEHQIRHIREVNQLAETLSLKGEDGVLLTLRASSGPVFSGDIVERTGLTTGRVANILKNLEDKRQIDRVQDQEDKRRISVQLTESGREAAEERYRRNICCRQELLDRLATEERDRMFEFLERLIEACGAEA